MAKSLRRLGRGLSSLIPDYRGRRDAPDEGDQEGVSRETESLSADCGGEIRESLATDQKAGIAGDTIIETPVPSRGTARASKLTQGGSQSSGQGPALSDVDEEAGASAGAITKDEPSDGVGTAGPVPRSDTSAADGPTRQSERGGGEESGSAAPSGPARGTHKSTSSGGVRAAGGGGISEEGETVEGGGRAGTSRPGAGERGAEATTIGAGTGAGERGRTAKRGERIIVPGRGTSESDIAFSAEQSVALAGIGATKAAVPFGGTRGKESVSSASKGRKGSGEGMSGGAGAERRPAVGGRLREVETRTLKPNRFQPRRMMNEESVKKLAQSLQNNGMLQPIVARECDGELEIVVGERRWRAARLAELETVPVIVREANDEQALELALIENIHREDLNPLDRALAYRQYCDAFGLGADNVADKVGEDRTTVVNYLRLLELPKEIKVLLVGGRVSMGHARSLLGVRDEGRRVELANMVADGRLSVRALEDLVRREREVRPKPGLRDRGADARAAKAAHVKEMEARFEEKLGTKVRIYIGRSNTTGRVVIEFFSLDDFDRVTRAIGVKKVE